MIIRVCWLLLSGLLLSSCDTAMNTADITLDISDLGIYTAAINNTGEAVVVGEVNSDAAQLYDMETGEQIYYWRHTNTGDAGVVASDFSGDGHAVLTADSNTLVKWDTTSGEALGYWIFPVNIRAIAASFSGEQVLIGFEDSTAMYFDLERSLPVFLMTHDDKVNVVDLSQDGRFAVTGADDMTSKVWDLTQDGMLIHEFKHKNKLKSVALSAQGTYVIAAAAFKPARVWQVDTGKLLGEYGPDRSNVISVDFSPDESLIVMGYSANRLLLIRVKSRKQLAAWNIAKKTKGAPTGAPVIAVGFAGDHSVVAAAGNGFVVRFKF